MVCRSVSLTDYLLSSSQSHCLYQFQKQNNKKARKLRHFKGQRDFFLSPSGPSAPKRPERNVGDWAPIKESQSLPPDALSPGHLCCVSPATLWLLLPAQPISPPVKLHHDASTPLWRQVKRKRFTIGNLYTCGDPPYTADFDDRVKTRRETKASWARRSKAIDKGIA